MWRKSFCSSRLVTINNTLKVVADDPDDDMVLECAVVRNGASHVVTGDRHLLCIRQLSEYRHRQGGRFPRFSPSSLILNRQARAIAFTVTTIAQLDWMQYMVGAQQCCAPTSSTLVA